jgi:hypothetical protein
VTRLLTTCIATACLLACDGSNALREHLRIQETAHQILADAGMNEAYLVSSRPGVWFDTGFGAQVNEPARDGTLHPRRYFGPRGHLHLWQPRANASRISVRGRADIKALSTTPTIALYLDRRLLSYQTVDAEGNFAFAERVPTDWQLSEGIHDLEICLSSVGSAEAIMPSLKVAYVDHVNWEQ